MLDVERARSGFPGLGRPPSPAQAGVAARLATPVAAALLALYALACVTLWVVPEWQPRWDCSTYLLTAQSLAAGAGYAYQGEPFFLRPPGFSAMVAPLVGPESFDPLLLNRFVMAWAAAAVVAVYLALRPLHGSWLALAVALLTGTSPFFVRTFNFLFAEYPFLALLFAGCGMLHASARRGRRWWLWALGGGLCLAGAAWLRTVAVLAVPGALLVGWRADRGRERWRPLVGAALPVLLVLPWILYARSAAEDARRPADQFLLFDYGTAMFHVDPGDPASPRVDAAGWLERVEQNGAKLLADLDRHLLHVEDAPWLRWVAGALVLGGLAVALRRRPSTFEAWTVAYLALLLTYFTFANRLVQPLMPFLYLYALLALAWLGERAVRTLPALSPGRRGLAGAAPAAAVALLLLAANARDLDRHRHPRAWPYGAATQGEWWDDLATIAEWVRANTPEDAVLLCNAAPTLSALTGRRAYTFRFPRGTDLIRRYDADYLILDAAGPRDLLARAAGRVRQRWSLPSSVPGVEIAVWRLR